MALPHAPAAEAHMSKTVPQLKKIDRSDPERVEQISAPYDWQKPAAAKVKPVAVDPHAKTVPVGKSTRRR